MLFSAILAATCICGLDHAVSNECCEVLWSGAEVKAEKISPAVSLEGYKFKTLYVAGDLDFYAETESADGTWTKTGLKKRMPGVYDLKYVSAKSFRIVANKPATNVTAVVNLANPKADPATALRKGGPLNAEKLNAGEPCEPFSIHGFDTKFLSVSTDNGAKITIEFDITGTGVWLPFRTFKTADKLNISNLRAYRIRATADRDCKATVQMEYK